MDLKDLKDAQGLNHLTSCKHLIKPAVWLPVLATTHLDSSSSPGQGVTVGVTVREEEEETKVRKSKLTGWGQGGVLTAGPGWAGRWGCRSAGAGPPGHCGCWTWAAWTEAELRCGSPPCSSTPHCCLGWCGGGTAGSWIHSEGGMTSWK